MNRPWTAERDVSADLAQALIETQFPSLAPARLASFGIGWDNTAFLVNDAWVFRFPRREIAVELIETEARLLPVIARRLPLPVPVPTFVGAPGERFPWPFAGYEVIAGRTACVADLDDRQRHAAAPVLAEFLARLHAVGADEARTLGAPPDTIRRMDVAYRAPRIAERLAQCVELGLVDDPGPLGAIFDEVPASWTPAGNTLVHGDLYARHLLVDDGGRPSGIIDWGDVHLGDRSEDVSIAAGFLPPSAHDAFFNVYGEVDEDTWRMARFRALHAAVLVLVYGHDIGDTDLQREARASLRFLITP
ncbi:MAG: phosphotransferase [Planctomycetes bacterium]|nr:phosphotransferase [Planctomycetota bacterium]